MRSKKSSRPVTQRQLRVGEMIKQALGIIFVRGEAKLPNLDTNNIGIFRKLLIVEKPENINTEIRQ